MKTKSYFKLRFNFFFVALMVLLLYWPFFSLYRTFTSYKNLWVGNGKYHVVTDISANFLNTQEKWNAAKIVNSSGDTLVVAPSKANIFIKKSGDTPLRSERSAARISILIIARTAVLISIFTLAAILLIRFFTGLRKNTIFYKRNIRAMRWIALCVLIFWFVDGLFQYIDFKSIEYLFEGTDIKVFRVYPIDKFSLLIVSGVVFFLSTIMEVGNKINEENRMTI